MFINDLAITIKSADKGIFIDNEKLCILLYADDIVLVFDNENDPQLMLDILSSWCKSNSIIVLQLRVVLYTSDQILLKGLLTVLHMDVII
jgi:hypothetical protein